MKARYLAVAAMSVLFAANAHAILLTPAVADWTTNDNSNLNAAAVTSITGITSLTLLYKQNVGGGEEGSLASSYTSSIGDEGGFIDYVSGLSVLGFVEAREGAHAEAEAHFNAVLAQRPDQHAVRLTLTQIQIAMGKPEAAVATLAPLLVAVPTDPQLLQVLDVLQLGSPEGRASVDAVAQSIEASNPESPIPGVLRGRARLLAREYQAAADQFRLAVAKEGGRYPLVAYYVAQRAAGDQGAAQQALEQWVEANPADQDTGFLLAAAYLEQGQSDRARTLYEKLVGTAEVDSPIVLNNLAWLYGEINDPRAIETARQAHQQAPNNGGITDTLGWLLVKAGEVDEGIQMLRLAVQQVPDSEEVRSHLDVALAQAGDKDAAQRQIERILPGALDVPPPSSADGPR